MVLVPKLPTHAVRLTKPRDQGPVSLSVFAPNAHGDGKGITVKQPRHPRQQPRHAAAGGDLRRVRDELEVIGGRGCRMMRR